MRGSVELVLWSFVMWNAVANSGCSLPRGVSSSIDAGPMDAFVMGHDSGTLDDSAVPADDAWTGNDAYIPGNDAFLPPNDAFVPPNDAFVPPDDAWMPPPTDAGPPGCDAVFMGMATNYQFCSTDSTSSCTFYLQLGAGSDCSDVCGRTGHTCVAAIDNDSTNHCTSSGGAQTCTHNMTDGICTCSWP